MLGVGDVVGGRFVIVDEGTKGGMGAVFRARDQLTGGFVALKVLDRVLGNAEIRFRAEVKSLAQLSHDAVVGYVDHGSVPSGAPYLAMQWLEGEDLAKRLTRGPLSIDETLVLGSRMASALAHVHEHGLVHRDVKPANIFLEHGDVASAKLLDFGIVRFGPVAVTASGSSVGTPGYMSPEQVRGEAGLEPRTDLFALGCVLYECVAGEPAFSGATPFAMMVKILAEEPETLARRVAVPSALATLIAHMLAKSASDRPATALAVHAALTSIDLGEHGRTTNLPPPSLTRGERRLVSVILTSDGLGDEDVGRGATIEASASETHWLVELHHLGARIERLADGSTATLLSGGGAASDLVVRAARAALVLRRALPSSHIALATGQAETNARFPVGEAINRAAVLLAEACEPGVLVDGLTLSLLDDHFEFEPKGGRTYIVAERDLGASATRPRAATPMVGRTAEMRMLEATYEECVDESIARTVVVTGEPGIGKSRLREEFLAWVREKSPAPEIWFGRGDPTSSGGALVLARQIARRAFGLARGPTESEERLRVVDYARSRALESPLVAEFLGELAGVHFPDAKSAALRATRSDPRAMGDRLRSAWLALVDASLERGPLVIAVDDVHWADGASIDLVDVALRAAHDRPLMIVALGRPEAAALHPTLVHRPGSRRLDLDGISGKAAASFIRNALGDAVDDATLGHLVQRAAGNPFHLEELVRALRAGGGEEIPRSVAAMLQARLDALDAETRRVLRAASILGDGVEPDALRHLLGIDLGDRRRREWLDGRLGVLVEREMLVRASAVEGVTYSFRHDVVREVVYGTLTDGDRTLGHRLAGEYLERWPVSHPAVLAHHFERGERPSRAAPMWLRAARMSLDANDPKAAATRADRGLACAPDERTAAELELVKADAKNDAADLQGSLEAAKWAFARLPDDSPRFPHAVAAVVAAAAGLGQHDMAIACARRVEGLSVEPLTAIDFLRIALQLLLLGERTSAKALIERVRLLGPDDGLTAGKLAIAESHLAQLDGDVGRRVEADARAVAAFERTLLDRETLYARTNAGLGLLTLGKYTEAVAALRGALDLAERIDHVRGRAGAAENLAWTLMVLGQLDESWALATEALKTFESAGDERMAGVTHACRARVALARQQVQEAEVEARSSLALLVSFPLLHSYALATLAETRRAAGARDEALAIAVEAMAELEKNGCEFGEELTRVVHAELLHETGARAAAAIAIRSARRRLIDQAWKIADPPSRMSFLYSVPENSRILDLAEQWTGVSTREIPKAE